MSFLEKLKIIKDPREICERCLRPPKVCVCSVLPPPEHMPIKIQTRWAVMGSCEILQYHHVACRRESSPK
jgi:hypothetical protein